jgi:ubiquinone/menaquinone biosynthesis C-methylase UbiE
MADKFLGIDLSPYFIAVGQRLLELCPTDEDWVTTIEKNDRIELRVGNVVNTSLDNESVDAVNVSLVIHEMPIDVTLKMCQEAYRILKPGGQLYISEMDFDSPAYAAQRENAMLFSLLRSTEPYLDEYADGVDQVRDYLAKTFQSVKITAATGRHFALVATKGQTVGGGGGGSVVDTRFDSQGNYAVVDTHLKVWESKEQ